MIEHRGDLFEHLFSPGQIIAISTNGYIKRNGCAVMGRGCAKQAAMLYHDFPQALGRQLKLNGNVPCYLTVGFAKIEKRFMVLPVKHEWHEKADIVLVEKSVAFLGGEAQASASMTFHVPRLGCGNGKLDWESQVLPLMLALPSNVIVHH